MGAAVNGPDLGSLPDLGCKEAERKIAPSRGRPVGRKRKEEEETGKMEGREW
jgi:hypothetical protein